MLRKIVSVIVAVVIMVFLIGPIVAILPLAFTSNIFLTYPIHAFSFRWFETLMSSDTWHRSIVNSLIIGSCSTLLATVLGTMAALGLRGKRLPFAGAVKTAFLLPMVVPAVVLGVGTQIVFGRMGIASTYIGVIAAHTVLALPFVLVNVLGSLSAINPALERAASSLGAKPLSIFVRVVMPLAMPGIVSGAVFAFATSLDEVVITLFVAGPNQWTLALQMFSSLRENVTPAVTAAAFVLILGTMTLIGVTALVKARLQRGAALKGA
ncbi:polyamine ABC transporter permease (plasmid) [Paraburkholderia caffeinilytica]|uniref:2-aminoethylphosphonate transport system permease protein PhnV n=2 Tax=Paraburkholderia TaxID=1822464 RepID=A0A6J5FKG1_9BURK|nr:MULTISPECIES: ABC transporter permease [Paraburkholderia]AXL53973.1 polyamine ABC transporter permease [Paraburkholderia caffeinilytica]CAB3782030.1 Putative 2-aminoethylphosphonate transport system permease protein PhnV [Paraburkholderia caffeinitolerans]CAB3802593.1 Putative 2-aminoethylphosphonate transport system permease protein PhnV [Paraburkholderia caffeinilytica]